MSLSLKISHFPRVLALALCLFVCINKTASASVSSITIDAKTGKVLTVNNADESRYPASLTKLMTLYITFDALEKGTIKLNDKLKVSRNAANKAPSRLGLKPGTTITVRDAVLALITKSANDCASVLAENLGRSEDNFGITMTKVAKQLGMKNTTFKNASGLPNKAQKTTARDMALLGSAMYNHFPQYYPLFSTKSFVYQGRTYYSHNRLLKTFEGADGMKTGFTNAAGYNIVTSASRDGHRVISVTMGHKTFQERDKKVADMMNKGLTKLAMSNTGSKTVYAKKESKGETIVANASISAFEPTEKITKDISGSYGIQVGAFSNYAKARTYASEIKKEVEKKFSNIDIIVEPASKDSTVVYRSKIIGFEKKDAQAACNGLKKTNKSCIVVAIETKQNLVVASNEQ